MSHPAERPEMTQLRRELAATEHRAEIAEAQVERWRKKVKALKRRKPRRTRPISTPYGIAET